MYQLLIEKQVQKQLESITEPYYTKVRSVVLALANDPRPNGYRKLKGRSGYRIRIGDYRVVYDINDGMLKVFVIAAGHRKDIYD